MMIQSVWKNLTGLQKAAEHLWCDFKWATNSSPNTNDLHIHYMDKSIGIGIFRREKGTCRVYMYTCIYTCRVEITFQAPGPLGRKLYAFMVSNPRFYSFWVYKLRKY